MYSHSHTCTYAFLSPPLSCDRICPLFMFFEGASGSRAAGALGTDMNKWTVLHSSMRREAKQPEQEILLPLSKGLLKKGHSYNCGSFQVVVEHTHVRAHIRHKHVHAQKRMAQYYTHTARPICVRPNKKVVFCSSNLQQAKRTVPKTWAMERYRRENRELIFDSNAAAF